MCYDTQLVGCRFGLWNVSLNTNTFVSGSLENGDIFSSVSWNIACFVRVVNGVVCHRFSHLNTVPFIRSSRLERDREREKERLESVYGTLSASTEMNLTLKTITFCNRIYTFQSSIYANCCYVMLINVDEFQAYCMFQFSMKVLPFISLSVVPIAIANARYNYFLSISP